MTDKITLKLTLDELKTLDKHIEYNEETKSVFDKIKYAYPQPQMTLANSGEFDVVSYNCKLYYRFGYPDSDNFSWYKTQDVPKGYVTGVFEPITDAETERLLEGLYYNHIVVKKEKEQQTKSPAEEAYKDWWGEYPTNTWQVDVSRWVAFQAGYNASKEEKVSETAQERGERVHKEMEAKKLQDKEWNVDVKTNLKPHWEPTPQTPEQVADGLKEAFREAVKQGVVSSTKSKTLTDLIYDWWGDVFTTHSDWDMETSIANLVDEISLWLPTEHCTNSYKWNQCIRMIREKLR